MVGEFVVENFGVGNHINLVFCMIFGGGVL